MWLLQKYTKQWTKSDLKWSEMPETRLVAGLNPDTQRNLWHFPRPPAWILMERYGEEQQKRGSTAQCLHALT